MSTADPFDRGPGSVLDGAPPLPPEAPYGSPAPAREVASESRTTAAGTRARSVGPGSEV
ncbi:hypothetical protein ACF9IK_35890 [Kitasatospora hibisci]|uniref:hypothetical protein n=1 Tax=Kitasatospora hibisci TaxID=3369522 RepID=UPI0037550F16